MTDFLMPKLGADMTGGTLVAWHKKAGDTVKRGDIVAEVETDKGVISIEVFIAGIIEKLVVQPGQRVLVGALLATIREDETTTTAEPKVVPAIRPAPSSPAPVSAPDAAAPVPASGTGRLRISPSARALAERLGVNAATVLGTGRDGAITREDIEQAASLAPAAAPASAADRHARMRQTIANAMSRSKREIPHYYLSTTINLHAVTTWLAAENERRPVPDRLISGVLFLKATALALREVPELNSAWVGDRAVSNGDIHVGVAISLRKGGLIAPALHHTDRLTLTELMDKFRDLVNRTRTDSLRSSELADPTITVTSLGERGVETVFPIIYPPQVAMVGFGKVVQRPWVDDGQVVARPVVTATLAADHRVSDGHRGGLFLAAVDRLLQEPGKL